MVISLFQNCIVLLWFSIGIYQVYTGNKNFLLIGMLISLIIPRFVLNANIKIPPHYFVFLLLAIWTFFNFIIKKQKTSLEIGFFILPITYFFLLCLVFTGSLNGILSVEQREFFGASLFGLFIFVVELLLFSLFISEFRHQYYCLVKSIDIIFFTLVLANLGTAIFQLFFGQINIFQNLYSSQTNNVLGIMSRMGGFHRATGLFPSPVNLGVFTLLSFAYFIYRKQFYISLLSCSLGILAASKTAIIGIPCLSILVLVFISIKKVTTFTTKKSSIRFAIFLSFTCPILLVLIYFLGQSKGVYINYYLKYLIKPFDALHSRYTGDITFLKITYESIKQHWLIGSGFTFLPRENLGDSMYIFWLKTTGILGMCILFTGILTLLHHFLNGETGILIFILAFLFSGLALTNTDFFSNSIMSALLVTSSSNKHKNLLTNIHVVTTSDQN